MTGRLGGGGGDPKIRSGQRLRQPVGTTSLRAGVQEKYGLGLLEPGRTGELQPLAENEGTPGAHIVFFYVAERDWSSWLPSYMFNSFILECPPFSPIRFAISIYKLRTCVCFR